MTFYNGFDMFSIGFYNIDLGANYFVTAQILDNYNITLMDYASDGNMYSYRDLYSIGLQQIKNGLVLSLISISIFFCSLMKVIESRKKF